MQVINVHFKTPMAGERLRPKTWFAPIGAETAPAFSFWTRSCRSQTRGTGSSLHAFVGSVSILLHCISNDVGDILQSHSLRCRARKKEPIFYKRRLLLSSTQITCGAERVAKHPLLIKWMRFIFVSGVRRALIDAILENPRKYI